jgi:hypothetical protein
MNASDRKDFAELLASAMAFYRQDLSTFALSVWWEACQGFSMEQLRKALTQHAMDPERGQFAPKPADLVRLLHGTQTDRSLVAWGHVLAAISRCGMYGSPDFQDQATVAAIIDIGGWPAVCQTDIDELPHLQRRFCNSHRTYSSRPESMEPTRLVGLHEQTNSLRGVLTGKERVQIGVRRDEAEETPLQIMQQAMKRRATA